jgi:hypothetical protein
VIPRRSCLTKGERWKEGEGGGEKGRERDRDRDREREREIYHFFKKNKSMGLGT